MGSKMQAAASAANAKRMKEQGIRRRTTPCPVCYVPVSLPYNGHQCRDRKRSINFKIKNVGQSWRMPSLAKVVAYARRNIETDQIRRVA